MGQFDQPVKVYKIPDPIPATRIITPPVTAPVKAPEREPVKVGAR